MDTKLQRVGPFELHLRCGRWEQDLEIAREVISRDCYRLKHMRRIGVSFDSILDIGGHIGSFGVWAKHFWPKAKLIAVEPNKESCELYELNAKRNGLKDYSIINAAVSYQKDPLILLDGQHSTGGGVVKTFAEAEAIINRPPGAGEKYRGVHQELNAITVEELLQRSERDEVDLAKIDCEGAEVEILREMSGGCAARFNCIIGEYHLEGGFTSFRSLFESRFPGLRLYNLSVPQDNRPLGPFFAARGWPLAQLFFLMHWRAVLRSMPHTFKARFMQPVNSVKFSR